MLKALMLSYLQGRQRWLEDLEGRQKLEAAVALYLQQLIASVDASTSNAALLDLIKE